MDLAERTGSFSARHPWEVARAEILLHLLERHDLLEPGSDWLDAGAGDAWFAMRLRNRLPPAATITCWDVNYSADDVEALGEIAVENVTYVAERPKRRFDQILMLDVLEHVDDDVGFVTEIVHDLLRQHGCVLVSVPAYQALWSSHDRAFRHRRRYSPATCRRLLERSGLVVISSGGLFVSLLPVRFGRLVFDWLFDGGSAAAGVGRWSGPGAATRVLTRALATDGRLSLALSERGRFLPGLSFWALCRLERG